MYTGQPQVWLSQDFRCTTVMAKLDRTNKEFGRLF